MIKINQGYLYLILNMIYKLFDSFYLLVTRWSNMGGVAAKHSIETQKNRQKHHDADAIGQTAATREQVIVLGGVNIRAVDIIAAASREDN